MFHDVVKEQVVVTGNSFPRVSCDAVVPTPGKIQLSHRRIDFVHRRHPPNINMMGLLGDLIQDRFVDLWHPLKQLL